MFFLPSRKETFGLVILEAMASGCAVVSTSPLDFRGARVAPGDVPAMIGAIDHIWSDRRMALNFGEENRRLAESRGQERQQLMKISGSAWKK